MVKLRQLAKVRQQRTVKNAVVRQLNLEQIRRRRSLISAQRLERSDNPGINGVKAKQP